MATPGHSHSAGLPKAEKKIGPFPESAVKAVVTGLVVVGAIVGVLKYTGRDKDAEGHAKNVKGKLEKKGQEIKDSWK